MADTAEMAARAEQQYGPIPDALLDDGQFAPTLPGPGLEVSRMQRFLSVALLAGITGSAGVHFAQELISDPDDGHTLVVPGQTDSGFAERLGSYVLPPSGNGQPPGETSSDQAATTADQKVPEWSHYKIQPGDTFWDLEQQHGWPTRILQHLNPKLDPYELTDQNIRVPGAGLLSQHLTAFGKLFQRHGGGTWMNGNEPGGIRRGDGVLVMTSKGLTSGLVKTAEPRGANKPEQLVIITEEGVITKSATQTNVPVIGRMGDAMSLQALHDAADRTDTTRVQATLSAHYANDPSPAATPSVSSSPTAEQTGQPVGSVSPSADPVPSSATSTAPGAETSSPAASATASGPNKNTGTVYALPQGAAWANVPGANEGNVPSATATPSASASQKPQAQAAATHNQPAPHETHGLTAEQQRLLDVSAKDVGHYGITSGAWKVDPYEDGSWCAKQVMAWFEEAGIHLNLGNNFGPRVGPTSAGGSLLEGIQQHYEYQPNSNRDFKPEAGDIVFFRWSPTEWHTGMVIKTSDGTLITREGASNGPNTGNSLGVNQNHWVNYRNNPDIVGFGRVLSAQQSAPASHAPQTHKQPQVHQTQTPSGAEGQAAVPGTNFVLPPGALAYSVSGSSSESASPQAGQAQLAGATYAMPAGFSADGGTPDWSAKPHPAASGNSHEYGPNTQYNWNSLVTIKSGLNVNQLNKILAGTPLEGYGAIFHQMENEYDVNALFAIAHADLESTYETSTMAQAKHNIYGINALTSDPSQAHTFNSFKECIDEYGRLLAGKYTHPGETYYAGKSIKDIFVHYSDSHKSEPKAIVQIMLELLHKLK